MSKKGCQYCRKVGTEYQHTYSVKISIDAFGKKRVLIVECDPCPPYAKCSRKGIPTRSAFVINFCPECGRDLRSENNA